MSAAKLFGHVAANDRRINYCGFEVTISLDSCSREAVVVSVSEIQELI